MQNAEEKNVFATKAPRHKVNQKYQTQINTDQEGPSHVEIDLNNLSGDYIIGELA